MEQSFVVAEAQKRHHVRVIEIPAPRCTTFDAKIFGVSLPDGIPPSHQERAYTSPVWYTPGGITGRRTGAYAEIQLGESDLTWVQAR